MPVAAGLVHLCCADAGTVHPLFKQMRLAWHTRPVQSVHQHQGVLHRNGGILHGGPYEHRRRLRRDQGFTFIPLLYAPELCIPIHPPADMPVGRLSLEQALQYRWLPVKEMYQTVYETSLLQEGLERGVNFTPVGGIRSASYGDPALKMVPAVYYRRPDLSFARVLDWGRGHRFGIVLGKKRGDPLVMAYVRALQQLLPSLSEKLFGLKLEAVEE